MPGDIMSKIEDLMKERVSAALKQIEEGFVGNSYLSEVKMRNHMYGWQKKYDPCKHGFTKICRHGCFWTASHRKNMERKL